MWALVCGLQAGVKKSVIQFTYCSVICISPGDLRPRQSCVRTEPRCGSCWRWGGEGARSADFLFLFIRPGNWCKNSPKWPWSADFLFLFVRPDNWEVTVAAISWFCPHFYQTR
jgi:hypothetical protein